MSDHLHFHVAMLRHETERVPEPYGSFGWGKGEDRTYDGTASFVDLRPVLSSYYHRTQTRVEQFLDPAGEYFLDAGSGPLSEDEYLGYSSLYARRVCVDLSERALREAREKLGIHGLYVVADLSHLPFRDGTFDGALASHVLYHVPEDEQAEAMGELYRTLKADRTCVIIYIWPTSPLTRLSQAPLPPWLRRVAARLNGGASADPMEPGDLIPEPPPSPGPPLYFHPHDYEWMRRELPAGSKWEIRVWRSLDLDFTRRLIRDGPMGAAILRVVYFLEELLPHIMARLGRYPMIILRKVRTQPSVAVALGSRPLADPRPVDAARPV